MPGNEKVITKFLVLNKGRISLQHLGLINSIGAPIAENGQFTEIINERDVDRFLATEDSRKKADIYINDHGVSLKQLGSSFAYNRLQRANLIEIFTLLQFNNPASLLHCLDREVRSFHQGNLSRRNRAWQDFFNENEFKALLKYLMMDGSPNVGFSSHPAVLILEAPADNISESEIHVYTFDEYCTEYLHKFKIAIRRQWIGQSSNSEHNRSLSLARKPENAPWVFDGAVGTPRTGWRATHPVSQRKTVYFLMLEKER